MPPDPYFRTKDEIQELRICNGYHEAIDALNTLQTSFYVLEERRKAGIKQDENVRTEMRAWLQRIGHSPHDLGRLNIVHVAGTKGKGTVCAYVDSILSFSQKSYMSPKKIGLFTSPHLVSVRERIRINSKPISDSLFAKYFFEVWDLLESSAHSLSVDPAIKPVYFRYLTLMSFHIFLKEGVDAAIFEVGVGGEYDSTNVIENPAVTGISTLGIDHVSVLGDTIDKIAWHKAGILKTGTPAFTVEQVPQAMEVIKSRACEKGVNLKVVPINPALMDVKIKPNADFQRKNASLAIVLAEAVLKGIGAPLRFSENTLPKEFVDGLEHAVWRGRFEVKREGNICWFLDGAHTADSLAVAAKWFATQTSKLAGPKVLIFNQQGRTEAVIFLKDLFNALQSNGAAAIDHVVFCNNVTYARKGYKRDFLNHTYDPVAIADLTVQKQFAEEWQSWDPRVSTVIVSSIEEALDYAKSLAKGGNGDEGTQVQVLVTGSLHLVGGALAVLGETVAS